MTGTAGRPADQERQPLAEDEGRRDDDDHDADHEHDGDEVTLGDEELLGEDRTPEQLEQRESTSDGAGDRAQQDERPAVAQPLSPDRPNEIADDVGAEAPQTGGAIEPGLV